MVQKTGLDGATWLNICQEYSREDSKVQPKLRITSLGYVIPTMALIMALIQMTQQYLVMS